MLTALYTETLEEFLERNESSSQWQALKAKFNIFPTFSLIEDFEIDFYTLFRERYDIREIGAETESLFYHFLNETIDRICIEYIPKVNLFIDNFNNLMDRKLTLQSSGDNKYYLNPITSQSDKLENRAKFDGTSEKAYSWFTSNAKLMNEMLEVKDIYNEALDKLEICFMGVL